jgi:hypothetical protein
MHCGAGNEWRRSGPEPAVDVEISVIYHANWKFGSDRRGINHELCNVATPQILIKFWAALIE